LASGGFGAQKIIQHPGNILCSKTTRQHYSDKLHPACAYDAFAVDHHWDRFAPSFARPLSQPPHVNFSMWNRQRNTENRLFFVSNTSDYSFTSFEVEIDIEGIP